LINKNFFKNKSILITGGTGSFGQALVSYFYLNKFPLRKIIVFSRDELKQFEMSKKFTEEKYPTIRFFLGDVRDSSRLQLAFKDVDIVVHAAALKQVPQAEYNPIEYIKTNVLGSQNIIEQSLNNNIKNVISLSTDKASSPINLYGATKLCADKLFVSANNIVGKSKIKFSVVRYGNVMGSRGSVLYNFLEQKKSGIIKLTNEKMTRFHISLKQSIEMVIWCIVNSKGAEIFVPKIPSLYVKDLAKAICNNCRIKIVGERPGEKIHEEMISYYDSKNTIDIGKYYAILDGNSLKKYSNKKFVKKDFVYRSNLNEHFLNVDDLKKIIFTFDKKK